MQHTLVRDWLVIFSLLQPKPSNFVTELDMLMLAAVLFKSSGNSERHSYRHGFIHCDLATSFFFLQFMGNYKDVGAYCFFWKAAEREFG